MAIFSLRHTVKTFSPKRSANERAAQYGQTAAHLRYITRPAAARVVLRARVEGCDQEAAVRAEQTAEKRGGRVAERFIVALPVEATPEQREALARAFAEALTNGAAGYVAAIHDKNGNDANNPHFHLIAFDAFEKSGGRGRPRSVIGMARKGAVEQTAALWSRIHNAQMAAWGYGEASRITHLSLAARGIDQIPTIHEGPGGRAMSARGVAPAAKDSWRRIDAGHTRPAANRVIRQINRLKREMDDENRADGLGGGDNRYPRQRGDIRDAFEPDRGGRGGDAPPPAVAFVQSARHGEGAGADRSPPFLAGRRDRGVAVPDRAPAAPIPAVALADPCPVRPDRGGRRVRRVWVELMMLCDTLRARLAPRARRAPPLSPEPLAPPAPERSRPRDRER